LVGGNLVADQRRYATLLAKGEDRRHRIAFLTGMETSWLLDPSIPLTEVFRE
jgi:hypothetical protein